MKRFKCRNNVTGWVVFAIAALTYLMTMEPSASLWDCAEFIATSYKLEVGHPPGAPLFMLVARIATFFAPSPYYVPHAVNAMSSLASAFCILFLFWTITHLARRIITRKGEELTPANQFAVLGAGVIGALAYTFTDTFWFSAVEGEVYALSSMFTALVVWLMLKWEEQADQPHAMRWIILIAYLMGLSIGVHLLNLLAIPTLVFIWYFRKTAKITAKGIVYSTLIAGAILLVVNSIIIPYTVYAGALVDLLFVNVLHAPANTGMVVFALLLIASLGWGVWVTHKKGRVVLNTILLSTLMIVIGYSSYASVTIRAAANPPMNSNNPDNPFALHSLLSRDQYGDKPLLYGPQYSAPVEDYTYKTVRYLADDGRYKRAEVIAGYKHPAGFMHLFPRMWNSAVGEEGYKSWSAYRTRMDYVRDEQGEVVRDGQGRAERAEVADYGREVIWDNDPMYEPVVVLEPTAAENIVYFFNYQLSHMYWRYFMWNFVGRQSDMQASDAIITDGNWLSGIDWIDEAYLGPQEDLPDEMAGNKGRNTYYFLPLLLGLIGLVYQLNRDPRNFSIVMWLFIMMGIALVVYFNTSPGEPRERDYVYAGSFYAFCIWIGFGVLAVRDLLARGFKKGVAAPAVATAVCLIVPAILFAQNLDDHDRSHRTLGRDIGWNYLQSTLPNAIVINYGDNDTFPLWFNQEVDGVRPDVRIMNSSYLGGEWYIDEMKTRANDAPGVPFSLPQRKYTFVNELVPVVKRVDRVVDLKEAIDFFKSDDKASKIDRGDGRMIDYLPSERMSLTVNKDNAIAAGIVREEDRDLMVDTIYFSLRGSAVDRSELMLLDMLAHFDWKRPIHFTQPHILQAFGLLDYLQFDGYSYRLVPILTPVRSTHEIGRIDPDYAAPLLLDTFRYGNMDDDRVYADHFSQYNLMASKAREAFARVAKEYILRGDTLRAVDLLDAGLEKLPVRNIRYTDTNTYPFIEGYYLTGEWKKGDDLMHGYAASLMQYIDYYLGFEERQGDAVLQPILRNLDSLDMLYNLAVRFKRDDILLYLNDFYRSLGYPDEELIQPSGLPAAPGEENERLLELIDSFAAEDFPV